MFRQCVAFVDDDVNLLAFLRNITEAEGIETYCFETQAEALEKMAEIFPGILFIDYRMPEGDGILFLKKMKEILPNSVKIMLTGEGNEKIAVQSIKSGADDYLVKPVEAGHLLEVIREYFKKFYSAILPMNDKYSYPLHDPAIMRYEFLRAVASGAAKNIKEACRYFTFSRQDYYNYEKRFRTHGPLGLLKKKDFEKVESLCKKTPVDRIDTLETFFDKTDPVQLKLEMLREASTLEKPNICDLSEKYGLMREIFYQLHQHFKTEGVLSLIEKKKGRPPLRHP